MFGKGIRWSYLPVQVLPSVQSAPCIFQSGVCCQCPIASGCKLFCAPAVLSAEISVRTVPVRSLVPSILGV